MKPVYKDVGNKTKLLAFDWWQNRSSVHPLTCGNDSLHNNLIAGETDKGRIYLECPDCDYIQLGIPYFVWKRYLWEMSLGAANIGLVEED